MSSAPTLRAVARSFGDRFRLLETSARTVHDPIIFQQSDDRYLLVFKFGATVSLGLSDDETTMLLEQARGTVAIPPRELIVEEAELYIDDSDREGVDSAGRIRLTAFDLDRLTVVSNVLAKSVAVSYREEQIAGAFDQIETLAQRLRDGKLPSSGQHIVERIGESLSIQTQTVGRVEVSEKPDLIWYDASLDRLYERLATEYELADRDHALARKLELIANVSGTYLDILNTRRSLRLEWYIVILILFEIVLILFDIFLKSS